MHFCEFFSATVRYIKKQTLFYMVRGVAQCLRRRSLAGELFLMPDLW